jgi:hypothetical protein
VTIQAFDTAPPFDLITVLLQDPACPTGDAHDKKNEALLLVKTGPTPQNAAAVADLKGVKGTALTELGYDIRKPGDVPTDSRGSHCGAGAPRFNIVIGGQLHFIGCNSPAPVVESSSEGWQRLRRGTAGPLMAFQGFAPFALVDITGQIVDSITIVFDEGQDTGPDNFGLAVLDNIDVNDTLVGRGPSGGK